MGIFDANTSIKGQVTVPVEIRKLIGLEAGGKLQFQVQADGQVKILAKKRSIKELKGLVSKPQHAVDVKSAIQTAVLKRDSRAKKS
jgi:antitoxin PrlF